MAVSNIPIFAMLKARMHWHQERQKLLAENIANADTPNFRPRDLTPVRFDAPPQPSGQVALASTHANHISASLSGSSAQFKMDRNGGYEIRPAGNAVSLEDEMLKVASNQMDYQAATTLYSRSLGLVKTALGKR